MQSTQSQDQELNIALVRTSSRWLRLARPLDLLFILFCIASFIVGLVILPEYASRHPEAFTALVFCATGLFLFLRRSIDCCRYNTELTLAAFAATLRDKVELDQLSSHLISVVQETMQPESVSLWLRGSK